MVGHAHDEVLEAYFTFSDIIVIATLTVLLFIIVVYIMGKLKMQHVQHSKYNRLDRAISAANEFG